MKKLINLILCLLIIVGLSGCSSSSSKKEIVIPQKEEDALKEKIANMTIDEKLGQMFLFDVRGWYTAEDLAKLDDPDNADPDEAPPITELNEPFIRAITKYHIGNVILFAENCVSTEQTTRLIDSLQQLAISNTGIPMIIAVDEEGGNVTRIGQGTLMPGNMAIGVTGNLDYAKSAGKVIGTELKAMGFNVNLAPDADVNSNEQNPIIGLRSFGSDPNKVGENVTAMIDGYHSAGIATCIKHFPGHGDTATDTHTGLALVERNYDDWLKLEAIPFIKGIDAGTDIVMTAHIQYPLLDDTKITALDGTETYLPATLSKKIITGILREKLGYNGVVSTDALDMDAIANFYGTEEAVIMAIEAGADLLCHPVKLRQEKDFEKIESVYNAVKNAISTGRITEDRLNESVLRILKLKQKYGILNVDNYSTDVNTLVTNAINVVGCEEHRKIEKEIASAAIQVANDFNFKGFDLATDQNLLVLVHSDAVQNEIEFEINKLQNEGKLNPFKVTYMQYSDEDLSDEIIEAIKKADGIIVGSHITASALADPTNYLYAKPQEIINLVWANNKHEVTAVLATNLPYQTDLYPGIATYICYGIAKLDRPEDIKTGMITGRYLPNVPAAIDKMFNK